MYRKMVHEEEMQVLAWEVHNTGKTWGLWLEVLQIIVQFPKKLLVKLCLRSPTKPLCRHSLCCKFMKQGHCAWSLSETNDCWVVDHMALGTVGTRRHWRQTHTVGLAIVATLFFSWWVFLYQSLTLLLKELLLLL